MVKANELSYTSLSLSFKYEDGKLFRLWRGLCWKEVDVSKCNHISGYTQVWFMGAPVGAHRIIYSLFHKVDLPAGMEIDHINGNRIDNTPANLRLVTGRQNRQNLSCHRNGRLLGTYQRRGRWDASIWRNGKKEFLGSFDTQEEAHAVYLGGQN